MPAVPRHCWFRARAICPWATLGELETLGVTAGASAPEVLVDEMIDAFRQRFDVTVEPVKTAEERIAFNVPRELRDGAQG